MKSKVKLIIIGICIIIASIIAYNFIINDDDLAPYIIEEYDKVYDIKSDIYDLSLIKDELTKIAQEYENNVKLTYAEYNIKENYKTAEFQFYNDDYNGKNKACVVTLSINIDTKKVTKIKYEKGHGKRVVGHSKEITLLENLSQYINSNEDIKIIVANDKVTLYKDEQNDEKYNSVKNITSNIGENYGYEGVITEINSDNIIFENQSQNKKYLIENNKDFKYINGRTNEEINVNDIKIGDYIDTSSYNNSKVISILSNINGEELRKELIKNISLENPILSRTVVIGKKMDIINNNKAILTITLKEVMQDKSSEEFEVNVEINSNTKIECKGGYNKIEQLDDVSIDVINVRLDENTINNEIPIAVWFMSSNGN